MKRTVDGRRTGYFPGGRICVWSGPSSSMIFLECIRGGWELSPDVRREIRGEWRWEASDYRFYDSEAMLLLELPTGQLDGWLRLLRYFCQRLVLPRARMWAREPWGFDDYDDPGYYGPDEEDDDDDDAGDDDLTRAKFYGAVELKYEAGIIVLIRKSETFKPTEPAYGNDRRLYHERNLRS
jgi:hypothetical protein